MKDPREVIIRPVITEHSYDMMNKNTYTFVVAKDSNKVEIRQAIEAEARSYSAGSHPHLEEGHGYAERRRHHRALQRVSFFIESPFGLFDKTSSACLIEKGWPKGRPFFVPFVLLKIPLTAESTLKHYKSLPHA